MSQYIVPYGSQQLISPHRDGFDMSWVKELALQDEDLDDEHKAVLAKLHSLLNALQSGDRPRIGTACTGLSVEARAHFAEEEELMLAADYPDRAAHIDEHEDLARRLGRIRYIVNNGVVFWSPDSELPMLERWFVPHLSDADRRFVDFMAGRSVKSNAA